MSRMTFQERRQLWRNPAGLLGLLLLLSYLALFGFARARAGGASAVPGDLLHGIGNYLPLLLLGTGWLLFSPFKDLRRDFDFRWSLPVAAASLLASCLFFIAFIVHFGRMQFGAYDYNVLVEIGWRQIQGQRPYVDFLTTTPPLFNLGIYAAYRLLGVSWDAGLYLAAVFSCSTFLCSFALLRRLSMPPSLSLLTAFAIEGVAMMPLDFWWYNNITTMLAAVFFLAALAYLEVPGSLTVQVIYVFSLAGLALAKPNIAGVDIAGCVLLLFVASPHRVGLLRITGLGAVLCLVLMLGTHVSPLALLKTYHDASQERGAFSLFGFLAMPRLERCWTLLWLVILATPLLPHCPPLLQHFKRRHWPELARQLLFFIPLLLAIYGVAGNGELRDVEFTALVAVDVLLLFRYPPATPVWRRLGFAFLLVMLGTDLQTGVVRERVRAIGPGRFFDTGPLTTIEEGPLRNMRVSQRMIEVERELRDVAAHSPGPFFYGPRLDFNYMALQQPSPRNLPAWWHPGTAFARSREGELIERWETKRFPTLIFFREDYTYYSKEFIDAIAEKYTRDNSYESLIVWRRKAGV